MAFRSLDLSSHLKEDKAWGIFSGSGGYGTGFTGSSFSFKTGDEVEVLLDRWPEGGTLKYKVNGVLQDGHFKDPIFKESEEDLYFAVCNYKSEVSIIYD